MAWEDPLSESEAYRVAERVAAKRIEQVVVNDDPRREVVQCISLRVSPVPLSCITAGLWKLTAPPIEGLWNVSHSLLTSSTAGSTCNLGFLYIHASIVSSPSPPVLFADAGDGAAPAYSTPQVVALSTYV